MKPRNSPLIANGIGVLRFRKSTRSYEPAIAARFLLSALPLINV